MASRHSSHAVRACRLQDQPCYPCISRAHRMRTVKGNHERRNQTNDHRRSRARGGRTLRVTAVPRVTQAQAGCRPCTAMSRWWTTSRRSSADEGTFDTALSTTCWGRRIRRQLYTACRGARSTLTPQLPSLTPTLPRRLQRRFQRRGEQALRGAVPGRAGQRRPDEPAVRRQPDRRRRRRFSPTLHQPMSPIPAAGLTTGDSPLLWVARPSTRT